MPEPEPISPAGTEAENSEEDQTAKHGAVDLPIVASLATAIASCVLAIVAFVALHGKQQEIGLIALAFVVPIFVVFLPVSRRFRGWPIAGPLLISLLCGTLALAGFGWWNSSHQVTGVGQPRSEGSRKGANSQPQIPALHIRFQDPQPGGLVKQCPRIDGTGTIPAGYGLWIIVVPDTSMQPKQYWIESQAKAEGPDYWAAAESISIDGPSIKKPISADVYAVLLDRKWSDYFAVSSATGSFSATSLPPTVAGGVIGPVTVARVSGTGICR